MICLSKTNKVGSWHYLVSLMAVMNSSDRRGRMVAPTTTRRVGNTHGLLRDGSTGNGYMFSDPHKKALVREHTAGANMPSSRRTGALYEKVYTKPSPMASTILALIRWFQGLPRATSHDAVQGHC